MSAVSESNDDFSRSPVANAKLRPWWYLLMIEMGVMISVPMFVLGGQLGIGLSLKDLVVSMFLGAGILAVIGAATAYLGALTRCSTALIARTTFGVRGAAFISLLLTLGMTGWWGVQTEMFADAVVRLAKDLFDLNFSRELTIGLGGAAMITTAALGIKAIGRLSYIAVPALVVGLTYALSVLAKPGSSSLSALLSYQPPAESALSIGVAAATVAGGFIVGAAMNPDYSRFARNTRHAVTYALADYALAYPILLVICGILAIAHQTTDTMVFLVPAGFSWLVFVLLMLSSWAANDCNLYSSSLGLASIMPKIRRGHLAVAAGFVGMVLAQFHVAGHLISFLTLLGILIAPISGVFLVEHFGRTNPISAEELSSTPQWRWGAIFAWTGGSLFGFVCTAKSSFGLGLCQFTTIAALDSVLAAALLMTVFRLLRRGRSLPTEAAKEADCLS